MILVTGGSGYVGSHIVRRLAKAGKPVRALVRDRSRVEREGRLKRLPVDWRVGDVLQPDTLAPAMQGAQAVVHTVAIAVEKGHHSYEEVNFQGTVNVVEAAKAAGVRRFIFLSQLGASADLPYRFLASKGRAEDYVAASGLEWTAFRPAVIWGPEDKFANSFAKLLPFSPLIFPIVGGERSRFQPVWIEDVVSCVVQAVGNPATAGKIFELGGPEVLTLEQIERRTLQALGARRLMVRFPMPVLRAVVALMEAVLPAPPVTRGLLELLAVSNVTDQNSLGEFVAEPRAFTAQAAAEYMRSFRARDTLAQFLGR
jgi:NADH dehydrogenase